MIKHPLVLVILLVLVGIGVWGAWINELEVVSTHPISGGLYGRSVHTFGDFAIVGDNTSRGGATIYIMPDTEWVEQGRIEAHSNVNVLGQFGFSVSLEASIAVITAPHISVKGIDIDVMNISTTDPASVYIYNRDMSRWNLAARFTSLQPGVDGFGYSVSIGANYIAVGAPFTSAITHGDAVGYGVVNYNGQSTSPSSTTSPASVVTTAPNQVVIPNITNSVMSHMGAVYMYRSINETWEAMGVIVPFETAANDLFGWSVDLSPDGTRLIVGAPGDTIDGVSSGSAFVYTLDEKGQWKLEASLTATDEEPFDSFGYSVGVENNDVIVGTRTARAAYIFHKSSLIIGTWEQEAKLVGADTTLNDGFGNSVSIFGAYAVVGAPQHVGRGAVYLWELDMGVGGWVQILKITSKSPNSGLGSSVAIGRRFMIAGAPKANNDMGMILSLMYDTSIINPPSLDHVEDTTVLIRFSGSSTSMDMLVTRKILADAAGTGTAQTEVRIVDIASNPGPISAHLFGLQIRFTTSSTMPAGSAAQNLLAALPDIRFRLNAAVGAISGTAEILPAHVPIAGPSKFTMEQAAAFVILILIIIFTLLVLVYYTAERRKRIAADKRDFEAAEAEREAKKKEAAKKERQDKKNARPKRASGVMRKSKRKDRTFLQAENDAAGLSFNDGFDESMDIILSPRGPGTANELNDEYYDLGQYTARRHDEEELGPTLKMDDATTIKLDEELGPSIDELGPSLNMEDELGPTIKLDEELSPTLKLDEELGPSLKIDHDELGPSIKLDELGPSLKQSDELGLSLQLDEELGPSLTFDDDELGPTLKLDEDDGLQLSVKPEDEPMVELNSDEATSSRASTADSIPLQEEDEEDQQSDQTGTSSARGMKRPLIVPKLSFPQSD